LGELQVRRTAYSKPGEQSIHPLDEVLQLPDRIYSYELQRHVVREAVKGPFSEALESVLEFTREKVPKRSIEELMQKASVDFEDYYGDRKPTPPEETSEILVATADCKGITMIESDRPSKGQDKDKPGLKRMAVVTGVYTVAPRPRTPEEVFESLYKDTDKPKVVTDKKAAQIRPEHKRLAASLEKGKDAMFRELAEEVERRDPNKVKVRVALTDGELALKGQMKKHLGDSILILDVIHALGYIRTAARLLHPDNAPGAEKWSRKQTLRVLQGKVSQVVRGLRQSVTKRGLEGKLKTDLLAASKYLYKNRHHMRYDHYLAEGYPIATGVIEGACKNIINDRMERSGMSWSARIAEAIVKLRAIYLSGDLADYWAFHVAAEQRRIHPPGRWEEVRFVD